MAVIQTARGQLSVDQLGATLMHEHIFMVTPGIREDYPEMSWDGDRDQKIDAAVRTLCDLKALGVDSLVDLTVPGLGRDIQSVEAVAARVPINIVLATGYYTFDQLPVFVSSRAPTGDSDILVEMFLRDINSGIGASGLRAGILKCCTDAPGVTPHVDRILRAVAVAHRETGVPISTHTNARLRTGLDQQRILAEEGVDLSRVVIGHSGDTTDLDYLRRLMDAGSFIGCDRFGYYIPDLAEFEARIETIVELCAMGYADRIVLGHDAHCHMDMIDDQALLAQLPRWRYSHIPSEVVPALAAQGVAEEHLHAMMVDNPRRVFERQGSY